MPGSWFLVLRPSLIRGRHWSSRGYTFIELLVVATIILILASAIMPLAQVTSTRAREAELRRALRDMRTAIDKFKDAADLGQIAALDLKPDSEGYPADLEQLVEGVSVAQRSDGPQAEVPSTGADRSDDALDRVGDALVSGRARLDALGRPERLRRLYDFGGTGLDGTRYKDW